MAKGANYVVLGLEVRDEATEEPRRRERCPQVTLLIQQSTGQGPRVLRELRKGNHRFPSAE